MSSVAQHEYYEHYWNAHLKMVKMKKNFSKIHSEVKKARNPIV